MWKEALAVLGGFALLTFSMAYYENSKSAQKIENIKSLYDLKTTLERRKDSQDTQQWIDSTQVLIDSMNNIK